jgi:hypothetical protein
MNAIICRNLKLNLTLCFIDFNNSWRLDFTPSYVLKASYVSVYTVLFCEFILSVGSNKRFNSTSFTGEFELIFLNVSYSKNCVYDS